MAVENLIVGMFTQNSPRCLLPDDPQARLNQLEQGMNTAFGLLPAAANSAPDSTLRIFTVPEYFFRRDPTRSEQAKRSTAYSADEKNFLMHGLRNLSLTLPNLLIIGGSILWVDPEGGAVFVRNTVPVHHNGNRIHFYEKKNECGELEKFETVPQMPYVFKPGSRSGVFTCLGLRCGLETCMDHQIGQLRTEEQYNLDLQFIIANTVTLETRNVQVQPRGYVIHCDVGAYGCNVYKNPFDAGRDRIEQTDGERSAAFTQPRKVGSYHQLHGLYYLPWPA